MVGCAEAIAAAYATPEPALEIGLGVHDGVVAPGAGATVPLSVAPTGKPFEVDFCTAARWDNDQIVEENRLYDLIGMVQQIGLGG
jgi:SnoaL-like polyketide cyclase